MWLMSLFQGDGSVTFSFQGTFCGRMWDGLLCWDETPAGTSVTQNCPDHPDRDSTGKKNEPFSHRRTTTRSHTFLIPAQQEEEKKIQSSVCMREIKVHGVIEKGLLGHHRASGSQEEFLCISHVTDRSEMVLRMYQLTIQ